VCCRLSSDIENTALPRYQEPNPIDLYFFAADQAIRRIGLPGTNIHLCLELNGRVDVDGLRRSVDLLRRIYPAVGSRLEQSSITGRPRRRLDAAPHDPGRPKARSTGNSRRC
jgi:hypothetical protein